MSFFPFFSLNDERGSRKTIYNFSDSYNRVWLNAFFSLLRLSLDYVFSFVICRVSSSFFAVPLPSSSKCQSILSSRAPRRRNTPVESRSRSLKTVFVEMRVVLFLLRRKLRRMSSRLGEVQEIRRYRDLGCCL